MGIVIVNKDNFKEEVLDATTTVLVDFYATWCGPCQMMHPVMDKLAAERDDVKICKIDVDQERDLAMQYKVMSIPTFLVFKNGEVVNRAMGAQPQEAIEELLK